MTPTNVTLYTTPALGGTLTVNQVGLPLNLGLKGAISVPIIVLNTAQWGT